MFRLPFVIFSLILVPLLRYCEWRESIGLWTACPTYADVLYSDLLTLQFGCRPSPSLFNVHFIHQMAARCGRSYHPGRNNSSMMTALLLLMAGVERNPGPRASTNCFNSRSIVNQQRSAIRLGSLNAGGATTKAAIIDDLIRDNRLDILAVCESWILDDAPDAIKYDIAPDNYSVLHVHRQRSSKKGQPKRGGGLTFIYNNQLSVKPIKSSLVPKTFELQLVGVQVGNIVVKVANIYRPPGLSKSAFLDEFADLLASLGSSTGEGLIISTCQVRMQLTSTNDSPPCSTSMDTNST